ncbi:MAG: protein-PII uridylyltransferase, partial [SAR324 cluster bacterium]|nr:protein-PII uridylyltransferase [SAR324 cluster bacterium]
MDTNFSPIENFPFLSPFIFTENPQKLEKHKKALQKKLVNASTHQHIENSKTLEYLEVREKVFAKVTAKYYEQQYKIIVEKSLITDSSFETLAQNTRLLDSIIHTAFEFAFTDLPMLKERIVEDLKKESRFKKKTLPINQKK